MEVLGSTLFLTEIRSSTLKKKGGFKLKVDFHAKDTLFTRVIQKTSQEVKITEDTHCTMPGRIKGQRKGPSIEEDTPPDLIIKKQGASFFISTLILQVLRRSWVRE